MSKYHQPTSKIFDSVSYQSYYGNDTGHEVLEVPVVDLDQKKTQYCKIGDCRRPVTPMPSGGYFALCDVHKLNSRNNGSDFRGTIESHLSGPFRYVTHRLISKITEQVGNFVDTASTPSVEEVARADNHEIPNDLPKDQLHLDPQVIGRITIGLRALDNKGSKGDKFMDFYYMNRLYAKHKYDRDSKPEKLIRFVWNHLLRYQEIDRVKLLAILVGLKVIYDNDVDHIRTGEKKEYMQIQTSKMLLRQLTPFTKTWPEPHVGPNNFKVKPKLNKKENIRFGKEALELADWVLMGQGGRKINDYVLEKSLGRRGKLFVTFGNDGRQIYRPAVKLSM